MPVSSDDPSLGQEVDGLRAELSVQKTEFKLGEDIPVALAIRNTSGHAVTLMEHRDPVYRYTWYTRFVVRSDSDQTYILGDPPGDPRCFAMREASHPGSVRVKRGASYTWSAILNRWRAYRKPLSTAPAFYFAAGTYRIYADYMSATGSNWRGTLRSNVIEIKVGRKHAERAPDEVAWGPTTRGIRCGLRLDKVVYGAREPVTGTIIVERMALKEAADSPAAFIGSAGVWYRGVGFLHIPLPGAAPPTGTKWPPAASLKPGQRLKVPFAWKEKRVLTGTAEFEAKVREWVHPAARKASISWRSGRMRALVFESVDPEKASPNKP